MNYECKLNSAIDQYKKQIEDIERFSKREYETLKTNCDELFKSVINNVKYGCRKYVSLQMINGDCRPTKPFAYITFDNGNSINKIKLEFNDEMFHTLAYYIDKINCRNI